MNNIIKSVSVIAGTVLHNSSYCDKDIFRNNELKWGSPFLYRQP